MEGQEGDVIMTLKLEVKEIKVIAGDINARLIFVSIGLLSNLTIIAMKCKSSKQVQLEFALSTKIKLNWNMMNVIFVWII